MNEKLLTEKGIHTVYGTFKKKRDEILFQSPLERDLNRFLNENRLCVEFVNVSGIEDLKRIPGKTRIGYYRMYFRDGAWFGRWFLDTGMKPDEIDCVGVDNIIAYIAKKYPRGCDYFMNDDCQTQYAPWGGKSRYLVKPRGSENYYVMFDTTYGNGDYPVRIYVYR